MAEKNFQFWRWPKDLVTKSLWRHVSGLERIFDDFRDSDRDTRFRGTFDDPMIFRPFGHLLMTDFISTGQAPCAFHVGSELV